MVHSLPALLHASRIAVMTSYIASLYGSSPIAAMHKAGCMWAMVYLYTPFTCSPSASEYWLKLWMVERWYWYLSCWYPSLSWLCIHCQYPPCIWADKTSEHFEFAHCTLNITKIFEIRKPVLVVYARAPESPPDFCARFCGTL
jgi:hypothetical protein